VSSLPVQRQRYLFITSQKEEEEESNNNFFVMLMLAFPAWHALTRGSATLESLQRMEL
jgi:hypothetical protein